MSLRDRLNEGTPIRLGEFARMIGYSREKVRQLVDLGAVKTVCLPGTVEKRVPPGEAERICKELRLI